MAHAAFVDGHWSNTGAAICARLSAPYLFRLSDQARSGSVSLDFGIQLRHVLDSEIPDISCRPSFLDQFWVSTHS